MEISHNQCRDLKARYEEASSETQAKHKEDLQNLQKMLSETGESLKAAQKENSDLLQEIVELKKQADKAKVCHGRQLRGCSSWLEFCTGPGGCLESTWDEPGRPLHVLTCRGRDRVLNHVSCGFRCSVPAAVLLRDGDGCMVFPLNRPCSHQLLCRLLPAVTELCCLSSACLLVTDSLLFFYSWPSCCQFALGLGETCRRKAEGRGQVK